MNTKHLNNHHQFRRGSYRIIASVVFPLLLLLTFTVSQFVNLDVIGWSHGFNHPLEGWDHLITMLGVGIWAAQMRGKAVWMLPLAFVSVMSLGGLAGASGFNIPSAEGIILLSCAVFSVLITRKIRFSSKINVLIVAFFAFFHGFAHGQEISTSASLISYTMGFMLATLILHGAGILVAKLIMFTIGCFLAILIPNTSQANLSASGFTQNSPNSLIISVNQELEYLKYQSISWNLLDFENGKATHTQEDLDIVHQSNHTNINYKSTKTKAVSVSIIDSLPKHQANWTLDEHHAQIQFYEIDVYFNISSFNQYYPNINNSPGISLLSNGVGLTSPPLQSKIFSISSALLDSNTSLAPLIDTSACQLRFIKIPFSSSEFSSNYAHHCALKNSKAVLFKQRIRYLNLSVHSSTCFDLTLQSALQSNRLTSFDHSFSGFDDLWSSRANQSQPIV